MILLLLPCHLLSKIRLRDEAVSQFNLEIPSIPKNQEFNHLLIIRNLLFIINCPLGLEALALLSEEDIKVLIVILVDRLELLTYLGLFLLHIEFDELSLICCALDLDWKSIDQVHQNIYYRNFQYLDI